MLCLLLLVHYKCRVSILNEHHISFQYKIHLVTILASSIYLVLMSTASDSEELYWIILRNSRGSVWRSMHECFGYSGKYTVHFQWTYK